MDAKLTKYEEHYSEENFWDKLKKYAKTAGSKVVFTALELYYALQSDTTPRWAKGVIIGALGYFILPLDLVSDFLPGVGYTDDLATLTAAMLSVAKSITPEIEEQANKKLNEWFGDPEAENSN
ncbi:MAG: DUF1232 domain-containing protein [Bacteroidales bacterium]|nr:DUF1232 domain-containing protein [Bacteroidales bacterium]